MPELTMFQEIVGLVVVAIIVGFFVIRNETGKDRQYVYRKKLMTLQEIAEELCADGVFICKSADEVQMAYDHDVDAIPAVLQILAEAEMPAKVFNETSILVRCPMVYGEVS